MTFLKGVLVDELLSSDTRLSFGTGFEAPASASLSELGLLAFVLLPSGPCDEDEGDVAAVTVPTIDVCRPSSGSGGFVPCGSLGCD